MRARVKNFFGAILRNTVRAFLRRRRGAALTHKIKWSHCYFFPAVVIGWQCMSIRDCTAPMSPSTQARRAAMAKKRKTKAAAKKTAKKTTLAGRRRSSRRRYRSSTSHQSKIASHGPADVEGASIIARDAPAQVDNRGRRRDGGLGFTIVRIACGGGEEGRAIRAFPLEVRSKMRSAGGSEVSALADALGVFEISSQDFSRRRGLICGAVFLCVIGRA